MKKPSLDMIAVHCAIGSILLGTFLARAIPEFEHRNPSANSQTLDVDSDRDIKPFRSSFVQEPQRSLRPSFGSSLPLYLRGNERSNRNMLRVFSAAIADSRLSTVSFSVENQQVAFGAIVGADGWIATKASQLPQQKELLCTLADGQEFPASVYTRVDSIDLALVQIAAKDLPVIEWDEQVPARGSWLATTDVTAVPAAIGVASTGIQRIRSAGKPVLGVYLEPDASINKVLLGSGAEEAGLKANDRIYRLNGEPILSKEDFESKIVGAKAGDEVKLYIVRDDKKYSVVAKLMDLADELMDETEMEVTGRVSHRATGFSQVLIHDTVLHPNQCGGPLVNVDGRVVGLNIARAGRVTSYALPASVVRPVLDNLIEEARLVSRTTNPSAEPMPVR
ncbi:MAG: PDZ domain-containing protein [Planctomycetales bacterium]|nr:PDZ domain-containing protein [Planctomycetales bacterium]